MRLPEENEIIFYMSLNHDAKYSYFSIIMRIKISIGFNNHLNKGNQWEIILESQYCLCFNNISYNGRGIKKNCVIPLLRTRWCHESLELRLRSKRKKAREVNTDTQNIVRVGKLFATSYHVGGFFARFMPGCKTNI